MASNSKPTSAMRLERHKSVKGVAEFRHLAELRETHERFMFSLRVRTMNYVLCENNRYIGLQEKDEIVVYDTKKKDEDAFNFFCSLPARKAHKLDEKVEFLRWISSKTLAFITNNSIYHWVIEENSEPVKMFDRKHSYNHIITGYKTNPEQTWLLLLFSVSCIKGKELMPEYAPTEAFTVHSVENKVSFCRRGSAAALTTFAVRPNTQPINLLVYSENSTPQFPESRACILHLKEKEKNNITGDTSKDFFKKWFPLFNYKAFSYECNITNIEISTKHGLFYTMDSSHNTVSMYDLETARLIDQIRFTHHRVEKTWFYAENEGMLGMTLTGRAVSASVDEKNIISFIKEDPKYVNHRAWILRLATRNNWPGAEDLYMVGINQLLQYGCYDKAAVLAANAPKGTVPTLETEQQLLSAGDLLHYLEVLLSDGPKKTKKEVLEMCEPLSLSMEKCWLRELLKKDKSTSTRETGKFPKKALILVLSVYFKDLVPLDVIQSFGETMGFESLQKYLRKVEYCLLKVFPAVRRALESGNQFDESMNAFFLEELNSEVEEDISVIPENDANADAGCNDGNVFNDSTNSLPLKEQIDDGKVFIQDKHTTNNTLQLKKDIQLDLVKEPIHCKPDRFVFEDDDVSDDDGILINDDDAISINDDDAIPINDDDVVLINDDDVITVTGTVTADKKENKEDDDPEDCEPEIIDFEFESNSEHEDMGFIIL